MNYFFILGRTPSLSILEINAVLGCETLASISKTSNEVAIVSCSNTLGVDSLAHTMGGVIKGGVIIASSEKNFDAAAATISRNLSARTEWAVGRITFGLSAYSVSQKTLKGNVSVLLQRIGIALKKELKNQGVSARFVAPKRGEVALSSVAVEKNHLATIPHAEYVLLVGESSIDVGTTSAVQKFEEYSYRDFSRPHRDMKTGLLPPKLARAMVNLSGLDTKKSPTILDPFCGLGTILQEAFLLGYSNVWGSDISEKNIRATKENLTWLGEDIAHINLKVCDAKKLSSCFSKHSVDAIITEPTLGPTLDRQRPSVSQQEIASLCDLYSASFRAFHCILKNNGRVVIVFPVWLRSASPVFISCIKDILRAGFINITIPNSLKNILPAKTQRDSILVARPDARVARELLVLQKTTR